MLKLTIVLGKHYDCIYEMYIVLTLVLVVNHFAKQGLFCSRNTKHYDDIYRTFFSLKPCHITKLKSKNIQSHDSSAADLSFLKMQKDFLINMHLNETNVSPSFMRRNFSSLNMRGGVEYYSLIMFVQLIIFIFIFIFFAQLKAPEKKSVKGLQNLATNEFDANMLMLSTYHLTCIVIDRIINQRRYKFSVGTYSIVWSNELIKFLFLIVQIVISTFFMGVFLSSNWFAL